MIREILGPGGLLSRAGSGWEARPGQLDMALRVESALRDDERLLCEAGTGTGKTLAYLVPAILSGRKVVIATGTKTLQDQIARVDLPRLRAILPVPFSFEVMKGLGNYLCLRRFDEHTRQMVMDGEDADLRAVRAWMERTPSGDRADLPDLSDDAPLWREITSSPETRLGARCAHFERCFVTAMRRRAIEAQILVVNHHLYFADLALRARWPEAQVLPPHDAVVFDEAHQLEDVATEFFGVRVSSQKLGALVRDLRRVVRRGVDLPRVQSLAARLAGGAASLAAAVRARLPPARDGIDELRVPAPDDLWSGEALARYHDLDVVLEESAAYLERAAAPQDGADEDDRMPEIEGLARRAQALREELGQLCGGMPRDLCAWVAASPRNVEIGASPIAVGPKLGRALASGVAAAVFTSATLTVAGSFDYLVERMGFADTAVTAIYPSPFRYSEQALLYLATDLPEPRDAAFFDAAADRIAALCGVTAGRALVLFTSFRALRAAEARLRGRMPFPLLVQGEAPRHVLLAHLRAEIGSVLLATQSFWEGVDVPGEALSLVIIDKLPFDPPDEPLCAARLRRIAEDGGDGFATYMVPRAALALKQGFGRLIRTRGDRGVVALLDGRIARRSYGSTLLGSLPPDCPRTESLAEVASFWNRPQATAPSRPHSVTPARSAGVTPSTRGAPE